MKKLAFICTKGLDAFIEPIAREFEKLEEYQMRRFYVQTNQEIIGAVKWADIVFLEWANESAILATQIYDLKKKGVICRLHSYESLTNMPEKIDWTRVDYLIFVAPHIRDIVKKHVPDIEDKVCTKIIPNGVDMNAVTLNETLNPHDIAYVCNISHKKEPALALQIMAELVKIDPEFKLHVAGTFQDERYEIYMKHMAKEMGIEDNIIYYGFVSDMDTFWEGKGIILSTSIHEGHPMNVIEGMARGLLPVVHNFIGAKELYTDTWTFNTVREAVHMIHGATCSTPDGFRLHILNRGWTLENQMEQIRLLVDAAGEPKKEEGESKS